MLVSWKSLHYRTTHHPKGFRYTQVHISHDVTPDLAAFIFLNSNNLSSLIHVWCNAVGFKWYELLILFLNSNFQYHYLSRQVWEKCVQFERKTIRPRNQFPRLPPPLNNMVHIKGQHKC